MSTEHYEKIAEILFNVAYSAWGMNLELKNKDIFNDLHKPNIGDYVIEVTNLSMPRLNAIGKLIEVSEDGFRNIKIERLDGVIHIWEFASFVKIADEKTIKLLKES